MIHYAQWGNTEWLHPRLYLIRYFKCPTELLRKGAKINILKQIHLMFINRQSSVCLLLLYFEYPAFHHMVIGFFFEKGWLNIIFPNFVIVHIFINQKLVGLPYCILIFQNQGFLKNGYR